MASVVFDHVTKRFGDVVAVDDLDLEVADREFLVLLGPSGCGKSTALRMIAGLEEPNEGNITIGDRRVNGIDPKDRDLAMVFQSYALYPHKSVRQNIEFPLRSRKVPGEERSRLVEDAAAQLGLDGLLQRKPRELSGGQRQRVALARAIVRRPAVFLMDEPLSNLDAKMRTSTRAELVELHAQLGTTFVYVTHDQVEAMTMASRVAVLSEGALQQVGPPQEVYDRPASVFVAQFIGSPPMNVLSAQVVTDGERPRVRLLGGHLELTAEAAALAATGSGKDLFVGVRPEELRLADQGGADRGLVAKLRMVESLGHERHLVCELEGGAAVVVRAPASAGAPDEGTAVLLDADPGSLHLFDGSTGRRLVA
ncbi:MAG: ABC transporter ATP-binding protein [Actinomycetota bacterium]|nr:ABC transporter ATP-binding protein [Actinomycetota bacterium]